MSHLRLITFCLTSFSLFTISLNDALSMELRINGKSYDIHSYTVSSDGRIISVNGAYELSRDLGQVKPKCQNKNKPYIAKTKPKTNGSAKRFWNSIRTISGKFDSLQQELSPKKRKPSNQKYY